LNIHIPSSPLRGRDHPAFDVAQTTIDGLGKIRTMKTTIDAAGRLVIPREIRRQAGLRPGQSLEVRWRNGQIEIEPSALPVKLAHGRHLTIAVPEEDVEHLSAKIVEKTRDALADERGQGSSS
jgi:AbrB family looped-hinge helix DNA binding protein